MSGSPNISDSNQAINEDDDFPTPDELPESYHAINTDAGEPRLMDAFRFLRELGSDPDADPASQEELSEYNQALNANVSNFVTVKLSGHENYDIWHAQIVCLAEVYNMRGIFDFDRAWEWKSHQIKSRYEKLFKGWVISTIDQEVLKRVEPVTSTLTMFRKIRELYAPNTSGIPVTMYDDQMLLDVSPNDNQSTELMKELLNATMEGRWWKAKAILLKSHKDADAATMEVTNNGDTMLHSFTMEVPNNGDTMLPSATMEITNNGDTMLHLAVKEGKNYFVNQLLNFIEAESELLTKKNSEGNTALHTAVLVDNKQAAELLVNKNRELLSVTNKFNYSPLVIAYEYGQINTFLYLLGVTEHGLELIQSRSYLGVHNLVAKATSRKQYNLALKLLEKRELLALAARGDEALMALTTDFPPELSFWEALIYPSSDGVRQIIVKRSSLLLYSFENLYIKAHGILWAIRNLIERTDLICLLFIVLILLVPAVIFFIYLLIRIVIFVLLLPLFMLYPHLWKGLVYAGFPIKHIEKKKRDYGDAIDVLKKICNEKNKNQPATFDNFVELYGRTILEAARVDACEVVVEILCGFKHTHMCCNERWHNVFQLAILNRSEKVYNRLSPMIKHGASLRKIRDRSENWLTHLAAKLASSIVLSRTTGAALQLQLELQWHEEVKKLMLPTELTYKNVHMETSDMVFTREHADLLKEGEQWMKTTAESCSITAALIVTIVFAAAITVPGGSNQETGSPLFKKEIAFTIFEICDALSLFTGATALLVFLSILTTRFAAKDFLVSLPRRLILGLCALFISTTAMMVAFGAILFLVFYDQRPWMLAPIGLFACLPISVIVTLQLPLVLDLYQSTYISRFRKHKFQ